MAADFSSPDKDNAVGNVVVETGRDLVFMTKADKIKTSGIWGRERERKERSTTGSPRCTHTDNEGDDDDEECLFDFGRERSTTRIGGQQLHLHESPREEK